MPSGLFPKNMCRCKPQPLSAALIRNIVVNDAKLKMNKENLMNEQNRIFLIKVAYWLGIGADVLWATGLFIPQVFGILTGNPEFNPDLQTRLIMGIGD